MLLSLLDAEARNTLEDFLGMPVKQVPIFPAKEVATNFSYSPELKAIIIKWEACSSLFSLFNISDPCRGSELGDSNSLVRDERVSLKKRMLLPLVHEYCHAVFDVHYNTLVRAAVLATPGIEGAYRVVRGIDEAVAFWVTERAMGVSLLTEEVARLYERFGRDCSLYLRYFHRIFHKLSEERDQKYVVGNVVGIVTGYLPKVTAATIS